jgi:hypothetical protein
MTEQIEKLADGMVAKPPFRPNRGRFRPGDRRINREGRPRGSKLAALTVINPADCARSADRLQRFFVEQRVLKSCITQCRAPWIINLPVGFQFVDFRVDADRKGVYFIIRSETFPRIARGAPIPELKPTYNGLMFMRG